MDGLSGVAERLVALRSKSIQRQAGVQKEHTAGRILDYVFHLRHRRSMAAGFCFTASRRAGQTFAPSLTHSDQEPASNRTLADFCP